MGFCQQIKEQSQATFCRYKCTDFSEVVPTFPPRTTTAAPTRLQYYCGNEKCTSDHDSCMKIKFIQEANGKEGSMSQCAIKQACVSFGQMLTCGAMKGVASCEVKCNRPL